MSVMMYGSVVYATWPKIAGVMDVINITFVRIRSPVKTEFILGLILRPCLHITFFSPFLSAAPLIYLTYFNVMCEQHHSNSFNPF